MNKMKKFASLATAVLMTACMAAPMTMSLTSSAATTYSFSDGFSLTTDEETAIKTAMSNDSATDAEIAAYVYEHWDTLAADNATYPTIAAATKDDSITVTSDAASSSSSITISGLSVDVARTFEVYQIFTGTYDSNKAELNDVKWGSGVTSITDGSTTWTATSGETVLDATLTYLSAATDARDVISNITLGATKAVSDVTSSGTSVTITVPTDGYYVVKDVTNLYGEDDANSAWIVQVADTANIEIKKATPTVDKLVLDETTDAEEGATDGWGESADHAINEQFKFKLVATVPANSDEDMKAYETYKLKFNDTMSAGVTFEEIESVIIKNGLNDITLITTDYNETATGANSKDGLSWSLTIEDIVSKLKKDNGGTWGTNDLTVEVIYKAHLNEQAVISKESVSGSSDINNNMVDLEYSNNPDSTGTGTSGTGKTEKDYVWVFTYEVDNTKYSNQAVSGQELAGAEFKLYDSAGTTEIELIYDETLSAYRPIKTGETAKVLTSAESTGKFDIKGLDAGTYILKEETPPTGYNKCEDITITIGATHKEDTSGTTVSMTLSDTSNMSNDVVNKKGTTLPSTGGIGTTLFYVGGGAMVAVAGVFLITKKRMGKNEE